MKKILKKTVIALAALGLAAPVCAGTTTGVFLGVDALDFMARNGDLDFVTIFPNLDGTTTVYTKSLDPAFTWDFRLYGGLTFCGNDDLTLSWTRYHTNSHDFFGTPLSNDFLPSSIIRWIDYDSWADIYSSATFNLDEVYGVYGHTLNLGVWRFRFAGGLEWARLYSKLGISADAVSGGGGPSFFYPDDETLSYEATSRMTGFGPRIELDMAYGLPYGLNAFAKTNAVLLVANRHVELLANVGNPNTGLDLPSYDFSSHFVILPKLGIRLGLDYTAAWGSTGGEGAGSPTLFTVEAGWQADVYIHAVERPEGFNNAGANGTGTNALSNLVTKVSNFADEGFFIGVKAATSWI